MVSAQEHGTVRFEFKDKGERISAGQPIDIHTAQHSGGALAVPTGATIEAIPKTGTFFQAGARLIMSFISDATDIVESEESDVEIPVLVIDPRKLKSVGWGQWQKAVVGRETIKLAAMTGFTPAGTVDVTATAGSPARLCYKDAPEGFAYMFDPNGKLRTYIGDDTA